MTTLVYHDVAIVSVLDLQQVADKGVGSHAPNETSAGLRREKNLSQLHTECTVVTLVHEQKTSVKKETST